MAIIETYLEGGCLNESSQTDKFPILMAPQIESSHRVYFSKTVYSPSISLEGNQSGK